MPDETEVPAATEEVTTTPESATGEQEPQGEPSEERKGGVQKRIDELTRKAADAEREREFWRQQALKVAPEPEKPVEVEKPKEKPKADDFNSQEEFVEAYTDWKLEEREKTAKSKAQEDSLRTEQQKVLEDFTARTTAAKQRLTDFDAVMADADDIKIGATLTHEIVNHPHGPELQYFLAKNPDEAKRLDSLKPLALAREVGKLESRFVAAPAATPVIASKAPTPIRPSGGGASAGGTVYAPNLSFPEYEKRRNAELAARQ